MNKNTIDFYNKNASRFFEDTAYVDFQDIREKFISKLGTEAYILDFGCGSGRDAKYFLDQGYRVDAIDGSEKLCKLASRYTGIQVRNMLFQELSASNQYDGIWACSSILHLPPDELAGVMCKMSAALKRGGIAYTSFKYGIFAGERNGRFFTDMTEENFAEFMSRLDGLTLEEQWVSPDVRQGRGDEKWLNLILRKQ